MVFKVSQKFKDRKMRLTLETIKYNGHLYISGSYETKNSPLVVYCKTHLIEYKTTFTNYCRSRSGLPCCGKASVSQKLSKRQFGIKSREKMKQAALNRIRPLSFGQDWRRSTEARQWEKNIKSIWKSKCAITGIKQDIVMHHFFSGARYERVKVRNVFLYHPQNGIIIHKIFHHDFHKKFGFQKNTLNQFKTYIKHLETLISSQADWKQSEGSETRVYDPILLKYYNFQIQDDFVLKRIMKLHERLEEINEKFNQELKNNN
uniref:putative HNH homing endonuclease n=1 Tax=Massjukichlorella minus TaxID=2650457 RepID=UPI0024115747|nr:putative HNH homing endonuclease [Massjukichlorella minus]WDY12949.1 putative HNH homing endonuclease [Massjukichlorella minus]